MPALNIENEETYRLARELANIRGKSLTEVVTGSLQDSLNREQDCAIREDRTEHGLRKGRGESPADEDTCEFGRH